MVFVVCVCSECAWWISGRAGGRGVYMTGQNISIIKIQLQICMNKISIWPIKIFYKLSVYVAE